MNTIFAKSISLRIPRTILGFSRFFHSWIFSFSILILAFFTKPGYATVKIKIDGNLNLSTYKIEGALFLPDEADEKMNPEEWGDWVDENASSLSDLYGDQGYLDAAFNFEPQVDSTPLHLSIREGERYRFGRVDLNTIPDAQRLITVPNLECKSGKPFVKENIFRDRKTLLHLFGDAGFLHCTSVEKIISDTVQKQVNLQFIITTGSAIVFDSLIIRNTREGDSLGYTGLTHEKLLHSIFRLSKGDTVTLVATSRFEKKLKSTRVFNFVHLRDSLLQDGSNRSVMILTTEEHVPGDLSSSIFYETQYGAGISADWSHGNIWGQFHEGRLGGSVAQRKQSAYLGYSSPLFLGTSFRFDNDLITNWYQDSPLNPGEGLYSGDFEITNSSKLSKTFYSWFRDVETAELIGSSYKISEENRDRAFNLNFINSAYLTFLDDMVNTTRGTRFAFTWGNGGSIFNGGAVLSKANFDSQVGKRHNWLEVESGYYFPLHERFKLAFRLDGGRFFGEGGINSNRFFLGGPRNVRSYGWRQICPDRDSLGICQLYGIEPAYFLGSLEFRTSPFSSSYINADGHFKYLLGLQVVPFVDFGRVWSIGHELTPSGQGQAFGMGLRYSLLSIFNIRVDYAIDGWSRDHQQWILDLAQAF